MSLVAALFITPPASGQAVKAAVESTNLEARPFPLWVPDLGLLEAETHPLTLGSLGLPFVEVETGGSRFPLMIDTGTARGFVITTHAPRIPYRVEGRTSELNADGTPRGESARIRVETLSVIGKDFSDVSGTLSDWRMFSSEPFNGTVGLDFFLDRRLTLDYQSKRIAVTESQLPARLDSRRYRSADLVQPPDRQGHILYVRARVNGRKAIVYIDTGYSVSFIDPEFTEGLDRVERPGKFKVFWRHVPVEIGGLRMVVDNLRELAVRRGEGLDSPVAAVFGSDILSYLVLTVDLRSRRLIIGDAE